MIKKELVWIVDDFTTERWFHLDCSDAMLKHHAEVFKENDRTFMAIAMIAYDTEDKDDYDILEFIATDSLTCSLT